MKESAVSWCVSANISAGENQGGLPTSQWEELPYFLSGLLKTHNTPLYNVLVLTPIQYRSCVFYGCNCLPDDERSHRRAEKRVENATWAAFCVVAQDWKRNWGLVVFNFENVKHLKILEKLFDFILMHGRDFAEAIRQVWISFPVKMEFFSPHHC